MKKMTEPPMDDWIAYLMWSRIFSRQIRNDATMAILKSAMDIQISFIGKVDDEESKRVSEKIEAITNLMEKCYNFN